MYCPKCGTQNDDNAFRCIKCGEVIQPIPIQPQPRVIDDDPAMRMILPVGRSGLAIAAGYAGLFSILCFPAPIAIILGILAIIDIKRHPEKHGMGRAVFALIMGGLFFILPLLIILVKVLIVLITEGLSP
ncbi:MAG: zinc ribbon domain-containing protein [Planctomycetota bacterium]